MTESKWWNGWSWTTDKSYADKEYDDACKKSDYEDKGTASITGKFFDDSNRDGSSSNESGISSVKVELVDASGKVIATTTTNSKGEYTFSKLVAGDYYVRFPSVQSKVFTTKDAAAAGDTKDSDANTNGLTDVIHLGSGKAICDVDAGVQTPNTGSVTGRAFKDANHNNVDDGDAGIDGVTVQLIDSNGNVAATTKTNHDGVYTFTGINAGDYKVKFEMSPGGLVLVANDQGSNDTIDSDAVQATGMTAGAARVVAGGTVTEIDVGYKDPKTAEISGRMFHDTNRDNTENDANWWYEPGVAGVTVKLVDANGTVVATAITDSFGSYKFAGLAAGNYKVEFPTVADKVFVTQNVGADGEDSDANAQGLTDTVSLTVGQKVATVDAGVRDPMTSEIAGRLFHDGTRDNTENGAGNFEAGVAGITVKLLNAAGTVVATATTDSIGNYKFNGLAAGDYKVQFASVDGKVFVAKDVGTDTEDSDANSNGLTDTIKLGAATHLANVDAGVRDPMTGAIHGKAFKDANGNNVDDSEAGVDGVVVKLLSTTGVVLATTTTDHAGSYKFTGLAAGQYKVQFETSKNGHVLVTNDVGTNDAVDSDAVTATGITAGNVIVGAGLTVTDIDAGYKDPKSSEINGRLFHDGNRDNTENGAGNLEAGVSGVTVTLQTAAGAVVATTTTDAVGNYKFAGLAAGDYKVQFASVPGKVFVAQDVGSESEDSDANASGTTGTFSLAIGQNVQNLDAGVRDPNTSEIAGRLFHDGTRDDTENGAGNFEAGVAGITVKLLNASGNVVATTTTDSIGNYKFNGLGAGDYKVQFASVEGKVFVAKDVGTDTEDSDANSNGLTDTIKLGVATHLNNVDAGVRDPMTSEIAGRLFHDGTRDDTENGAGNFEAGVAGITVKLLNAAGNVVATATTDSIGNYKFNGLAAGDYKVQFASVDGKVFVAKDVGTDTEDSDANSNGLTDTIKLGAATHLANVDAGVRDPMTGAIHGKAFKDANHNNVDDSEAGVDGVTVNLLNTAGAVIATTTTDHAGNYKFTGLAAGDYKVAFQTTPGGLVLVTSDQGTNDAIDSDAVTATGITGIARVAAGQTVTDIDAGYKDPKTGAIEGKAFRDVNANSVDDSGTEPGIAGVTVRLIDSTGNTVGTTTTGADGAYKFTGLAAGDYKIAFQTATGGLVLVTNDVGTNDAIDSDAVTATGITAGNARVAIGQTTKDIDAGYKDPQTSEIVGRLFHDSNKDDTENAGGGQFEAGVGATTVKLLNSAGAVIATTTTDANGGYKFTGLAAGTYQVLFAAVPDKAFVKQNVGTDTEDSDVTLAGLSDPVVLGIAQHLNNVDAGVFTPNTAPKAVDDLGEVCSDDATTVNVLANDSDFEGPVTVKALVIGGVETAIAAGQTLTIDSGAEVTLTADGKLTYSLVGGDDFDALTIGQEAIDRFDYVITDTNGAIATATVEVDICGALNTVESIGERLPTIATIDINQIFSGRSLVGTEVIIDFEGRDDIDGTYDAFCIELPDGANTAANLTTLVYSSYEDLPDRLVTDPNADIDKPENLDLVNYVLNLDRVFNGNPDQFSFSDVQNAIWALITDERSPSSLSGTALSIYNDAIANGEGFAPDDDDFIGIIVEPVTATGDPASPVYEDAGQVYIVAVPFERLAEDCLCF